MQRNSIKSFELLILLSMFLLYAANQCGTYLHQHPSDPREGYSVMCYLTIPDKMVDPSHYPCAVLLRNLQGTSGYPRARHLLDAGGNFGCKVSKEGIWSPDRYDACQDNLNHSVFLVDCRECFTLFVCIRYPGLASQETLTTEAPIEPSDSATLTPEAPIEPGDSATLTTEAPIEPGDSAALN